MSNESGFTLIETLAAGLVSTIVAGALLTVLYMSTNQIKEGSANVRYIRLQSAVSEEIRANARKSKTMKRTSELGTASSSLSAAEWPGLKEIWLFNNDGDTLAAYQVKADSPHLHEWKAGSFQVFQVGSETVDINYANTEFGILPNRQGMTFRIAHRRAGIPDEYPNRPDTVLKRNR
jgi:type II secretory pathway pseudopilin PulG